MSEVIQEAMREKTTSRLLRNLSGCVLVVDDELPNRLYLRKLLEARECDVLDAATGADAIELAIHKQPDLILVDVMMPEMDGFELCGRLRDEARTSHIPVIMVTAKSRIEDIETGFELGAMDYIRKPFNPRELILRVGNALALKQSTDELSIWNKRVSRDLELAGAIQRSLFSDVPHFSRRFEARIAYRTCMAVGGDAFDIIALPDGRYCFYVADVSGHGVAPAMISSLLKASASDAILRHAQEGPAAVCNALNRQIRRRINNPSYFSTLFMAIHDPEKLEWRCMNCGHPSPVLVRNGKLLDTSFFDKSGGVPIGFPFLDDMPYSKGDEVVFSDEGDTFMLLYTDGLCEARHSITQEDCSLRLNPAFAEVVSDPSIPNKAVALMDQLESEMYQLEEDDCTAISIHMLDPRKIVVEQMVPRNIYTVSEVAKLAESAVVEYGISEETATMLRLLVMELGANLVDHSGLSEDDSFWMQIRVDGAVCKLVIIDKGDEWEVDDTLECNLDEAYMGERGRGLAIAHSIVDCIERYRVNAENMTYCTIVDSPEGD